MSIITRRRSERIRPPSKRYALHLSDDKSFDIDQCKEVSDSNNISQPNKQPSSETEVVISLSSEKTNDNSSTYTGLSKQTSNNELNEDDEEESSQHSEYDTDSSYSAEGRKGRFYAGVKGMINFYNHNLIYLPKPLSLCHSHFFLFLNLYMFISPMHLNLIIFFSSLIFSVL
jgi:hypothetical protein